MTPTTCRRPVLLALAGALVLGLLSTSVAPMTAAAQDSDPTTSTSTPIRDSDTGLNDIVPQPNSGEAPEHPSDRGGWQQFLVFGLIVGGMALIVLLVVREARRARA